MSLLCPFFRFRSLRLFLSSSIPTARTRTHTCSHRIHNPRFQTPIHSFTYSCISPTHCFFDLSLSRSLSLCLVHTFQNQLAWSRLLFFLTFLRCPCAAGALPSVSASPGPCVLVLFLFLFLLLLHCSLLDSDIKGTPCLTSFCLYACLSTWQPPSPQSVGVASQHPLENSFRRNVSPGWQPALWSTPTPSERPPGPVHVRVIL